MCCLLMICAQESFLGRIVCFMETKLGIHTIDTILQLGRKTMGDINETTTLVQSTKQYDPVNGVYLPVDSQWRRTSKSNKLTRPATRPVTMGYCSEECDC